MDNRPPGKTRSLNNSKVAEEERSLVSRANVNVKYKRKHEDKKEDVVGIERHVLLMRRYHQRVSFLFFSFLLVSTSRENLNGIFSGVQRIADSV